MFQTHLLSIIRSLNTVFTSTGICHASYIDRLLADSQSNYCCEYSIKTPDDGQISVSETCRVLYQNEFYVQWSVHRVMCVNNYPTSCNNIQFIYICKLLYVFRLVSTPSSRGYINVSTVSGHCYLT